ncbi:hypothetical protein E1202_07180 [Saccharopolyspora karakumensis]|uniref:Uncharacterized protein n=1 Tax=Saccharopolyspora karakumensis TaxID=2530386 RepID=A0A4R5BXA8_9PSEU|nr:hypothetical protein [Saccharopolyspora karakumensis]TDD90885.1 hypothetical protein E1202_07180 [Saccharopolyspora karakumensis]
MRIRRIASVLLASGLLAVGLVGSAGAQAPSGQVLVFIADAVVPVQKFQDPQGCHALPTGTHVVINDTGRAITLYPTPTCTGAGIELAPEHGAHELPAFGGFEA